jgi:hypothetical protein
MEDQYQPLLQKALLSCGHIDKAAIVKISNGKLKATSPQLKVCS